MPSIEPDERELGELIRDAVAVPTRPLSRAQTAKLLDKLPAGRRGIPLSAALGVAVVALLALVGWSIQQPSGVLRWVGLAALAANVGLSPLSATAILWRRRRAHVS